CEPYVSPYRSCGCWYSVSGDGQTLPRRRAERKHLFRPAEGVERATLRTRLHLLALQLRRLAVGVVERVADQHGHPTRQHLRLPVALDERVLAGRQEAEEL